MAVEPLTKRARIIAASWFDSLSKSIRPIVSSPVSIRFRCSPNRGTGGSVGANILRIEPDMTGLVLMLSGGRVKEACGSTKKRRKRRLLLFCLTRRDASETGPQTLMNPKYEWGEWGFPRRLPTGTTPGVPQACPIGHVPFALYGVCPPARWVSVIPRSPPLHSSLVCDIRDGPPPRTR